MDMLRQLVGMESDSQSAEQQEGNGKGQEGSQLSLIHISAASSMRIVGSPVSMALAMPPSFSTS